MVGKSEADEVRDFCIEVGRTLLICGLVEKHIKQLSRSLNISEWLDFKETDTNIHNAIGQMKSNYGLDDEFVLVLHEFRENRNKFVHQIWDLSDSRLNTNEGRQQALSFIVALYAIASVLNKLLYPHVTDRFLAAGNHPPDWGASLLSVS
jgi:hypothetical protein